MCVLCRVCGDISSYVFTHIHMYVCAVICHYVLLFLLSYVHMNLFSVLYVYVCAHDSYVGVYP